MTEKFYDRKFSIYSIIRRTMSSKNLDIVKLKIVLNTNKNTKVDLTSKLFIFDNQKVSGEYPFLCTNVEYSNSFLKNKTVYERVETFFNRQKFDEFVISSNQKKNKMVDVEAEKEKLKISEKNIMIMLNAIFPISFPIEDQVDRISEQTANFNFSKMFDNILKNKEYVYLNIDKPSTVIQVKWLDTLQVNPIYYKINKLIETYHNFLKDYIIDATFKLQLFDGELKKEIEELKKEIEKLNEEIQKDITQKEKKQKEIEELKEELEEKTEKQTDLKQFDDNIINYTSKPTIDLNDEIKKVDYKLFVSKDVKEIVSCKIIWKLYFLFSDFKPKSEAYNAFVNEYVENIINYNKKDKQNDNRYIVNSQTNEQINESNERQFNNDIKGLQFYFNFKKDMSEFLPPMRRSISPKTRALFQDDKLNVDIFETAFNKDEPIVASIDKLTDENNKITYEIQLGIALVGGKITTTNSKFWCEYNANKLGNDLNFLTINPDFDGIRLYNYIDLEDTSKNENYNNIINATTIENAKNGGTRKRRSNRRRSNRRRNKSRVRK